jgi:hypothetical protein
LRWLLPALLLLAFSGCDRDRDRSGPGLYRHYCARCRGDHGQGPRKPVKLYPHLSLLSSEMVVRGDRAAVERRILEGQGPMPSFRRRLDPAELARLVDFTLQLPSRKAGQ